MSLAIFDMDKTLLSGDSEVVWWSFLAEKGLVEPDGFAKQRQAIIEAAQLQPLDVIAYVQVSIRTLTLQKHEELLKLREEYLETKIQPLITEDAKAIIEKHQNKKDQLLIVTATNRFLAEPIADLLGITNLIATEVEKVDGSFTGNVTGTPSFRDGKVTRLDEWLSQNEISLEGSYFYSDSHHDLPLLKKVTYPIVVNPDPELHLVAVAKQWEIIEF